MPAKKNAAKATTTENMRDWSDMQDRLDGKNDFLAELARAGNSQLRKRCVQDPVFARAKFAEYGRFQLEEFKQTDPSAKPIPSDTVFRIFEKERAAREKLVTIVLDPNTLRDEPVLPDWRCTYAPYADSMTKQRAVGKKSK